MTDEYGLGCLPSPDDDRDFPVETILRSTSAPLPVSFGIKPVPPVLNQGSLPHCVAYSSAGRKMWEERLDEGRWLSFDTAWLYRRCKALDGNTTPGTTLRSALRVLAAEGIRATGESNPKAHRIAAYYRVPKDATVVRRTIAQSGPVLLAIPWYRSWFHTRAGGLLPSPDVLVGGHAVLATGWDNRRGLLLRNSWGRQWGSLGNFWLPFAYLARAYELWRCIDVRGDA
jgi:hypothetical protein